MVDLFKSTVAYRIISGDKKKGTLSHAYALVMDDSFALEIFLKTTAKLLMCKSEEFCDNCRSCGLIERGTHSDVTFYPREKNGKILVSDVDELVSQTYIKPIEGDKRIFVLSKTADMNASAQNKLLKTLEEPPDNVYILLGVENENALLPTIKSRVKMLKIPAFSDEQLMEGLKNTCSDKEKLERAISFADGRAGKAVLYYNDDNNGETEELVLDVLENMKTSRDVLKYSVKIDKSNIKEFLICLKKTMFAIMRVDVGTDKPDKTLKELSKIYKTACCVAVIGKINKLESALFFNGNVTMIVENMLLCILEEKYRWQKL